MPTIAERLETATASLEAGVVSFAAGVAAVAGKAPIASPTFTGPVTLAQDAASALQAVTKQQLDAALLNLGRRQRVRAATTANVTIATALNAGDVLDGVTLVAGDLVLVKNQTAPAENGVFVVGVSPARSGEFDSWSEFPGSLFAVAEGSTNADSLWLCTANDGGTLNTTSLTFATISVSDALAVHLAGAETITGPKTFSVSPIVSTNDWGTDLVSKVAMAANTNYFGTFATPQSITRAAGTPAEGQSNSLKITVTTAGLLTFPTCKRVGGPNTGITSLYLPIPAGSSTAVYELRWRYVGGEWLLYDTVPMAENFAATAAPTATDDVNLGYGVGSRWVDTTNDRAYICVDSTSTAAIWKKTAGKPRVLTITSSATPTINTDLYDAVDITALAAAITSATTNLTGSPANFDMLVMRIKDDGTARALAFGASFVAMGVAIPTTTIVSKVLTILWLYNSTTSKWGCIATAQEA